MLYKTRRKELRIVAEQDRRHQRPWAAEIRAALGWADGRNHLPGNAPRAPCAAASRVKALLRSLLHGYIDRRIIALAPGAGCLDATLLGNLEMKPWAVCFCLSGAATISCSVAPLSRCSSRTAARLLSRTVFEGLFAFDRVPPLMSLRDMGAD